jgi:predicted N-acetyltransferase YhbS
MKLSYGWVIIGAGALMTCVAIGAMFSLAVFLAPMSVETGWSRAGISSAMTLDFLTMGVAGFAAARPVAAGVMRWFRAQLPRK